MSLLSVHRAFTANVFAVPVILFHLSLSLPLLKSRSVINQNVGGGNLVECTVCKVSFMVLDGVAWGGVPGHHISPVQGYCVLMWFVFCQYNKTASAYSSTNFVSW